MIVLAGFLVMVGVFSVCGEAYYERDWPRMTWLRLAIAFVLFFAGMSVFAQGVLYNANVTTAASNVPSGAQAPVYTVPNAKISVCMDYACNVPVTVYTDATLTTVLPQPITTDNKGRFLFGVAPGSYYYSVKTPSGLLLGTYAFNIGGGTGNGFIAAGTGASTGISSALATCTAGKVCAVSVPPGVAQADATQPTGVGQIVVNNSTGGNVVSIANPYGAAGGVGYLFGALNCYQSQLTQGGDGGGSLYSPCNQINFNMSAKGPNYGYGGSSAAFAASGWHTSSAQTISANYSGQGIAGVIEINAHKYSDGDFLGIDINHIGEGGRVDGSGEAQKTERIIAGESNATFFATVANTTTNNTALHLNSLGVSDSLQVPELPGEGHFLVDQNTTTGRFETITPIDGGRAQQLYDSTSTYPVSPFNGVLAHAIVVDNLESYETPQGNCTILPFSSHTGTAPIGPTHIIDFDSTRHDQGSTLTTCPAWSPTVSYPNGAGVSFGGQNYTSTVSGNLNSSPSGGSSDNWTLETAPYQIASYIRQSHESGSMAWVDGMAGHAIWFDANSQGTNGLIYPFEILGTTDAHTLVVTQFWHDQTAGYFQLGRVKLDALPLQSVTVSAGGVAQIVQTGGKDNIFDQQASVTIVGNVNASLNGRYALPTDTGAYTGYGQVYTAILCTTTSGTCVPSTYTGTGTGGTMTIGTTGFGNTIYYTDCMAQIIDPNNPTTGKNDGSYVLVEPNPCSFSPGNIVQSSHHYAMGIIQHAEGLTQYNPIPFGDVYHDLNWTATGRNTGLGGPQAWFSLNQSMPASSLAGLGGVGLAPNIFNLFGAKGSLFNMDAPPILPGTPLIDDIANFQSSTVPGYYMSLWRQLIKGFGTGGTGIGYSEPLRIAINTGINYWGTGAVSNQFVTPMTFLQNVTAPGYNTTGTTNGQVVMSAGTGGDNPASLTAGTVAVRYKAGVLSCANGTIEYPCLNGSRQPMRWIVMVTSTSATSDNFTSGGLSALTTSNHCIVQELGSGAAIAPQVTVNAGSLTIYHAATAGIALDVSCDLP